MKKLLFNELNLFDIGNNLQIGGMLLTSGTETILVPLVDEQDCIDKEMSILIANNDDMLKLFNQMDIQETVLFQNGTIKGIVRKSQRNLDQNIVWEVFHRDNYTCRYCGATAKQMTYDHVKLWEDMGETTIENGVCACKKCNKTRGNMKYDEWLSSEYYEKVSVNLTDEVKRLNLELISKFKSFPNRNNTKSR